MSEGFVPGSSLGHYRIAVKIGEGGMGEVYAADDTKLDRRVAIKFLNKELSRDPDKLARFVREAKAASALNHPNILTVHEIGESDGMNYLATELIKGMTLRERLRREPIMLREILDVTLQAAAALNAAHSAGVVHRDIKPENIMLRDDGIVKVLDFGLAKLAANPLEEAAPEDATRQLVNTRPGMIMGTVLYMSPEQARGKETDTRSDVWSLGIVMYEMLTGHTPFQGETTSDSIAAILKQEPDSLDPDTPAELQRIIRKSLQKSADDRYQTVKDLLIDVKSLKRDLELSEELERSHIPHATGSSNVSTGQMSQAGTVMRSGTLSTQNSVPQHMSSAEYIVSGIKGHKLLIAGLGALMLLLAVGSFGIYKYVGSANSPKNELSLLHAKVTKLTTSGRVSRAEISPDGRYVVHMQEDGDNKRSLYVRQVATNSNIQIVPSQAIGYGTLKFSPDGDFVYYGVYGTGDQLSLYQIPTLGDTPKKILDKFWYHISFSPDGKKFAFERQESENKESLLIANPDGTGEETLTDVETPAEGMDNLAWSPDGQAIVYEDFTGGDHKLRAVRVSDRSVHPVGDRKWAHIVELVWAGNENLLMLAKDKEDGFQIWRVAYPSGTAERITNDPDGYTGLSVTRDANTIAVVKTLVQSSIWVAPANDPNSARAITSGAGKHDYEVAWAGDKVFFFSRTTTMGSENTELCAVDASTGNRTTVPLTMPEPYELTASSDGNFLAISNTEGDFGRHYIWRMKTDGTDLRQVTKGEVTWGVGPRFSIDGQWIYFVGSRAPALPAIWKIASDGTGEPIHIADGPAYYVALSPDGKFIAYMTEGDDPRTTRTAVVPIDGSGPPKYFPRIRSLVAWTADSRSLTYTETTDFVDNFMSQPIGGGEPKKLSSFTSDRLFGLDYSHDGKQLAFPRGTVSSDVLLYTNFK
ncbi:MAG: protein kinase [Acidobacteria bacterium]|nr:protein kinase [Acidobacteriota bacterium]